MVDINDILGASSDADAKAKTQALAQALRGQQALGGVFALTGDKAISGLGHNLMQGADEQQGMAFKANQARIAQANELRNLALKREQVEQGKFAENRTTGQLYNTKTGEPVGGAGNAALPPEMYDKRLPVMQEKMANDLDPNRSRSGLLKSNQDRLNAAQRILTLARDPLTGGPANLTPQQMSEVSTSLATLIGGGGSSEGTRNELTAHTKGRTIAEALQWVTDSPHGADQQAFVKQMIDTAERESATAEKQMRQAQAQRLANHLAYMNLFPEQAKAQIQNYGFDPSEVDFKTGKWTPKAQTPASPAGGGKPAATADLRKKYGL